MPVSYTHLAEMEPYYDVFYKQVSKFPKDGDVMSNYPEDFIAIKPLFTREWGDGVGEKPRVSLKESEQEQMRQCRSRIEQLNGKGYFDSVSYTHLVAYMTTNSEM